MDQPTSSCKPAETPWRAAFPAPYKIVQTPRLILLLYELDTVFRQIFLDGRSLPNDPQPYLGYSVGRWDGDTSVVTTVGFKDQGWLDGMGHPHSGDLHLEERFRRTNTGNMDLQVTINDPAAAYTAPFTYTQPQILLPDTDVMENFASKTKRPASSRC
jgi:hypothetical protein